MFNARGQPRQRKGFKMDRRTRYEIQDAFHYAVAAGISRQALGYESGVDTSGPTNEWGAFRNRRADYRTACVRLDALGLSDLHREASKAGDRRTSKGLDACAMALAGAVEAWAEENGFSAYTGELWTEGETLHPAIIDGVIYAAEYFTGFGFVVWRMDSEGKGHVLDAVKGPADWRSWQCCARQLWVPTLAERSTVGACVRKAVLGGAL